jgi:uncharacterized cupredoxin-like copper-binding protein
MKKIYPQMLNGAFALILFAMLAMLAACSSAPRQDVANRETADKATVTVVTGDFSFSVDATEVPAGTVSFIVKNNGNIPHDFSISGNGVEQKTSMIDPGKTAVLEVDLKPGTYTYICTVPGHEMLGMKGTLTVKSSS